MLIPVLFIYLFSSFTYFVMKQEFSHWMELRMDFLGRGERNVDPQHHFSLMLENIPHELRSDKALFDYFDRLFPGKVHSASVILNLPVLENFVKKRLRVVKRLEKAIAYYHATGTRPTHTVGQFQLQFLGVDIVFPYVSFWHFFSRQDR
jgi:Cytosolic domain of 10TM putative phosphate transporter